MKKIELICKICSACDFVTKSGLDLHISQQHQAKKRIKILPPEVEKKVETLPPKTIYVPQHKGEVTLKTLDVNLLNAHNLKVGATVDFTYRCSVVAISDVPNSRAFETKLAILNSSYAVVAFF